MSRFTHEIARYVDGERPDAPATVRAAAGAAFGAVFAVFVPILLLLWAVEGPEVRTRGGMLLRVDLAALLYPVGAVVTGALLGLTAPLRRRAWAAAALGAAAFAPWAGAIALCVDRGYAAWRAPHTVTTALLAVALGAPLGLMARHLDRPERKRRPSGGAAV